MDSHVFDELTRSLAAGATGRRTAVKLAAGGALAALLTRLGLEGAEAACARPGQKCGKRGNGKGKRGNGRRCCGSATCQRGRCRCGPGSGACGGRCVAACNTGDEVYNPRTCFCCKTNTNQCGGIDANCCSGDCQPAFAGFVCVGRANGEECVFGAQCSSRRCVNNSCAP